MENNYVGVSAVALERLDVMWLAKSGSLALIAALLPFFIHSQYITGPIINAILILALFWIGIRGAALIALMPSLAALLGGLLPTPLAPVLPFIMASNLVLIFSFDYLRRQIKGQHFSYWLGLIVAALLKFTFLLFSAKMIAQILVGPQFAPVLVKMFGLMQLETALLGGVLAWLVLRSQRYFSV